LVDKGECESEGVGGLSFDEMGVVILVTGHGSASHESSGMVSADTSGSWLNPDGGSVDACLKPAPCKFRNSCQGGDGVLKHSESLLFAISSPSLLLLTTGWLDNDGGQLVGVLPTNRCHSRASPRTLKKQDM
jgi:hypothetical protein